MMLDFIDIHEWSPKGRALRFDEDRTLLFDFRKQFWQALAKPYHLISIPLNDFTLTLDYESSEFSIWIGKKKKKIADELLLLT